jgi:hypothetical protein
MAGLTDYGEQQALIALLPNGTARYVGLFTTLPTADDGTGGVEASGSGYARKSHAAWLNTAVAPITYRVNNGAIEFTALTADLDGCVGWGVWDAAAAGNLIAFGNLKDVAGNSITKNFTSGNQPRFPDQELQIGIN